MKKILIISDSQTGSNFIQRTIETYTSENIYYIIDIKNNSYKDINPARFKFYNFDPTSLYKLANLLKMEFIQVFIAMESQIDIENTIKNIRTIKKNLRVVVLNKWNLINKDANVVMINADDILSSKLLDYLPNVPVIAQNVGLGEGEIMEVLVPFGSSFIYRHIGSIEQKNWRIVAIYRNRKLIMPNLKKMIHPNDLLILIGEPSVLKSVYKAIKRELGQFPEPFGSNLYLYLDMKIMNNKVIKSFLDRAVFTHRKFKHSLIIKIVNAGDIELVQYAKSFSSENIVVDINYDNIDLKESFFKDIKSYHVGLIIVSKDIFSNYNCRNMLYKSKLPVLKLSNKEISSVKESVLLLTDNKNIEKISSTVFDISEQMGFNIELFNYLNEYQADKEQIIEQYNNLAKIFSKSISITTKNENPIKYLGKKENFIQILPFTEKLTARKIYSFFSTDSERLYHRLDEFHQIFIPVEL